MMTLTYVMPEVPTRPFARGDTVEVLDRAGAVIGRQTVFRARGKNLITDCGRHWTQEGWWIGEDQAWPFPSIRHAAV